MERGALVSLVSRIGSADIEGARPLALTVVDHAPLSVRGGVAEIKIHGVMMRTVPWFLAVFGIDATGTDDIRGQLADAVADPMVKSIAIEIDSPGGTVAGTLALADDIRAAREKKPIAVHVPDLAASAAYWVGAQGSTLTAGGSALIGSIGTYVTILDLSKRAEAEGIKVHVVSSHELKGIGVPGAPLTEAQRADVQRVVDSLTAVFVRGVADGRGADVAKIQELATGQMWIGSEAKALGLVDEIMHVLATTEQTTTAPLGAQGKNTMAEQAQIDAMAAELARLNARLESVEKENGDLRAEVAQAEIMATVAEAAAKDALIAKHRDRVPPSALAGVRAYAETVGPEALEALLTGLPRQTNPEPVGAEASISHPDAAGVKLTRDELAVARGLGLTPEQYVAGQRIKRVTWDGKALSAEGEVLS